MYGMELIITEKILPNEPNEDAIQLALDMYEIALKEKQNGSANVDSRSDQEARFS